MERQWSLVVVLLLAVQARANPWVFGEDHPNFRVIFQISGQIWPFSYNTRQILTIPPCMSLKYVWVKVSNKLGFTPTVKFHRTLNVVSITYGLLQHTGSNYDIVAKGFRTRNCNPGVHETDNTYIPYRLKGNQSQTKLKELQRKGQVYKKALDAVDWINSDSDDDLKDKKYGYDNDSDRKYDFTKESNEDMSNEMKELGNGKKRNYIIFIMTGNAASQKVSGDNGGVVVQNRGSFKGDNGDDHGLDYGNEFNHKSSKLIGVDEYSAGKRHAKSDGDDRGKVNAKNISYRDDTMQNKKEANSNESGFKSEERNSMVSGYGGSSKHNLDKTISLGYGKGYGSISKYKNVQDDSYNEDSESYRHTETKNSFGNIKDSRYKESNHEENSKSRFYDWDRDIRYVGSSGDANNNEDDGSSGLDDDYMDVFDIGNRNQPDGRGKDISLFCSDYLRTNNGRETKNLALDKKVIDYCLFQVGRSNF